MRDGDWSPGRNLLPEARYDAATSTPGKSPGGHGDSISICIGADPPADRGGDVGNESQRPSVGAQGIPDAWAPIHSFARVQGGYGQAIATIFKVSTFNVAAG